MGTNLRGKRYINADEKLQLFKNVNFDSDAEDYVKLQAATNLSIHGDEEDKKKSVKILKKLADKGNVDVINQYAQTLRFGPGVEINSKEAAFYMNKSADLSDPLSMKMYSDIS